MRVETVVQQVRALCDLPGLVAELGFEPLWERIPVRTWLPGISGLRDAALIGRRGAFRWFGVSAADPRLARRVARRLWRRGEIAGVMVWTPDRRVGVSVTFGDHPLVILAAEEPDPAALLALRRMPDSVRQTGGGLATAAAVADCLDCSDLSRAFFRDFRLALDRIAAAITGSVPPADRLGLALLQLTRVLFLYYVQARGWLDGRSGFLADEVDRCLRRGGHVHRHCLAPLFFGTLNRPALERTAGVRRFGDIPFLNGGLFEPHPHERAWRGSIPNAAWRDAFDRLFERYCFTADESRREGRIAPDMLGRVFEGLMAPADRHASGTFYTPPSLVNAMVLRGLQAVLERRLGLSPGEAERKLEESDPSLASFWCGLTVLDPAVGSGAFLLGALEQLERLGHPGAPAASARRRILADNLFGVDLNPIAVRLTELRLWLAVIAEEPEGPGHRVAPLPNLDCLIRQGDSLTDPLALAARLPAAVRSGALEIARMRRAVVNAPGREKAPQARLLRQAEGQTARACLVSAEAGIAREIAALLAGARSPDLFGTRRGMDGGSRHRLTTFRRQRRELAAARRRLDREGEIPWFHYQSHFPDIFARRGGFDLVIGNPPWVRAEQLAPELRAHLGGRYRWWRAAGTGDGYRHQPDLAVAFLERAVELAAPEDGAVALLLPAKIATAGYGTAARAALVRETTLHTVADLSRTDALGAFDAVVYPMALVATRSVPPEGATVRTGLGAGGARLPHQRFTATPWILLPSIHASLDRLAQWPSLGRQHALHLGVKTGANRAFLDPPASIEPELLRWAVRGRDVGAFHVARRRRMLWTHGADGSPLTRLPPRAAAWLAGRGQQLERRADYRNGAPWRLFRTGPATAPYRVVWADLARRLNAAPLCSPADDDLVPLNSCYLISVPGARAALALAAWLNSTWIRAAARLAADRARGGFARFNARSVGSVPLPAGTLDDAELEHIAQPRPGTSFDQQQLDDFTARKLQLSARDRRELATVAGRGAGAVG